MTDWVAVASADHCAAAVAGGFTQLGHGRAAPVERLAPGDRIALYAPRERMGAGAPVQDFVAFGRVGDGAPWREGEAGPTRRAVRWDGAARPAPVRPLLASLGFVPDGPHWVMAFRRSAFRVPPADMDRIAAAMGCVATGAAAR